MADRLELARQALLQGNTTVAQELIARELHDCPSNPDAWLLLALLTSELQQRRAYIEQALLLDPQHAKAQAAHAYFTPQQQAVPVMEQAAGASVSIIKTESRPSRPAQSHERAALNQPAFQAAAGRSTNEEALVSTIKTESRSSRPAQRHEGAALNQPAFQVAAGRSTKKVLWGLGSCLVVGFLLLISLTRLNQSGAATQAVQPTTALVTAAPASTQPPATPDASVAGAAPGFPIAALQPFTDADTGIQGIVPSAWVERERDPGLLFVPSATLPDDSTDGLLLQWSPPEQWPSDSVAEAMQQIKAAYVMPPPDYDAQLKIIEDSATTDGGLLVELRFNKPAATEGGVVRYAALLRLKPYADGILVAIISLPEELFIYEAKTLHEMLDALNVK